MAFVLVLAAALLCALNNLYMRKSVDAGGTTKAFLVIVEAFSILVAVILGPFKSGHFEWSASIAWIGIIAGIFLGIMMWALGRAMEEGPPALTVAFLNSSAVVPAIFMVLIFGAAFGHLYAWWNGLGSLFVVTGLFWAVWETTKNYQNRAWWISYASIAFWCHAFFLVILQWRAMLINPNMPVSRLLPFRVEASQSEWFMPMIFFSATVLLLVQFIKAEARFPKRQEIVYGFYGGVCNGACTYFLVRSAQIATPLQNAMIFPLFAVALILSCNTWGCFLYKENVHWKAMAICLLGLFVGTMNWSAVF